MTMTERHIMIDLETLSTRNNAAIAAIGAYRFDPEGSDDAPVFDRMFHRVVRVQDHIDRGAHVDIEAIRWWMQQTPAAQQAAFGTTGVNDVGTPLQTALYGLADWMTDRYHVKPEEIQVWDHGFFDIPVLETAYESFQAEPASQWPRAAWHYRSPRDVRTYIQAAYGRNLDIEDVEPDFPPNPQEHHPGWDAWHQALMVQWCYRRLRSRMENLWVMPPPLPHPHITGRVI